MSESVNVRLPMIPNDQQWVCLSFLSNKEDNSMKTTGIRVGGVYESYEAACDQAKSIQQFDPAHHVFVGKAGRWLPYDPDPSSSKEVEDSEYANPQLNELMKGHKNNMEKSKLFHEIRKTEKIIDNVRENLERRKKNKEELTKKLSKVKSIDENPPKVH